MTSENHIERLLNEAKGQPAPMPPTALISRVLADAATFMPAPEVDTTPPKPRLWARMLAPIGGLGGVSVLAACAAFGVFAGADYGDQVLAIPGLDGVLAGLTDNTDSTTPFESLSLLMSEG